MRRIEFDHGVGTNVLSLLCAGAAMIWPTAAYILFGAALAVTVTGLRIKGVGLWQWAQGRRSFLVAYAERPDFSEENICVNELVNDAVPHVVGKRFKRCIFSGPASVVLNDGNKLDYPSARASPLWAADAGTDRSNAVVFRDCLFDRCFFDNDVLILVDPASIPGIESHFLLHSRDEWKRFRHYRGAH